MLFSRFKCWPFCVQPLLPQTDKLVLWEPCFSSFHFASSVFSCHVTLMPFDCNCCWGCPCAPAIQVVHVLLKHTLLLILYGSPFPVPIISKWQNHITSPGLHRYNPTLTFFSHKSQPMLAQAVLMSSLRSCVVVSSGHDLVCCEIESPDNPTTIVTY